MNRQLWLCRWILQEKLKRRKLKHTREETKKDRWLERLCVRPWGRGWGRRDADATWWAPGAAPARLSTCVIVAAQVCLHPPLRGERAFFRRLAYVLILGRRSTRRRVDVSERRVDVSMFPTRAAHLSLTACRGSVTTSFASRPSETRWSSFESASRCWPTRRRSVNDDASWRQFSDVATTYQENRRPRWWMLIEVIELRRKGCLAVIEIYGQWLTSGVIILNYTYNVI